MATTNFLSPIEFKFVLARLPNVEFFVQAVNVPGASSGFSEFATPFKALFEPGDKLMYDDLQLTVVCDENLESFREIQNWIVALTYPDNFGQFKSLTSGPVGGINTTEVVNTVRSDASLILLDSNKNPNIAIKFVDMFPTAISGIQLNTTGADVTPPTFDITFKYTNYTIEVIKRTA
jgi:hypothetical protein